MQLLVVSVAIAAVITFVACNGDEIQALLPGGATSSESLAALHDRISPNTTMVCANLVPVPGIPVQCKIHTLNGYTEEELAALQKAILDRYDGNVVFQVVRL